MKHRTSGGQLKFRAEDQVDKIGFGVKQASGGLAVGTDLFFSVYSSAGAVTVHPSPGQAAPDVHFSLGAFGTWNHKDGYCIGFWSLFPHIHTTVFIDNDSSSATYRQGDFVQEILLSKPQLSLYKAGLIRAPKS